MIRVKKNTQAQCEDFISNVIKHYAKATVLERGGGLQKTCTAALTACRKRREYEAGFTPVPWKEVLSLLAL